MTTRTTLLTVELVPTSLHGKAPRTVFGQAWWDRARRQAYRAAGYRCEVCGGAGRAHPVEAHERYEYDELVGPPRQRVVGIVALCPDCYNVKHLYRTASVASEQGNWWIYTRALAHLAKVNGWRDGQLEEYLAQVQEDFLRREAIGPWAYDYSAIRDLGR